MAAVAQALSDRLPHRRVLVTLDLVRAAVAPLLPFVTEIWQIYLLIFVLLGTFIPGFQIIIL